jgi:hypothetical protein
LRQESIKVLFTLEFLFEIFLEGISFYLKELKLDKVAGILKLLDYRNQLSLLAFRILYHVKYHCIDLDRPPLTANSLEPVDYHVKDGAEIIGCPHFVPNL